VPGSIQVPGEGLPIVLMRDCQTTGGYPKIATVISADLDRLAQVRPGMSLTFAEVTLDEALAALRQATQDLTHFSQSLLPAERTPDSEWLLSLNLISGVIDGKCEDFDA
jgi:allophanate hydrolase subunit 2